MSEVVQGSVASGYEHVADAFGRTLAAGEQNGSALNIRVDGAVVVDLWAGEADAGTHRPWTPDTPTVVFSCTKGLVAILAAQLVDEGRLDLDQRVAEIWPEFAAAGKDTITVRTLMAHRAGLASPRVDIDLETALDWTAVTEVLAAQEPLWQPGAAYGYHALTYGWLVGEVIRRVTGRSIGDHFAATIAAPLHADAWIGLPDRFADRVARLYPGANLPTPPAAGARQPTAEDARWMQRAMTLGAAFPPGLVTPNAGFDDPRVHRAEIPGAGGIATAAALATIWSATVVPTEGVRLLGDAVIDDMTRVQSEGEPVWWLPGPYPRWGTGFMLTSGARDFLSDSSFGHDGAGGQVAFADRDARVGFGYVTNRLEVANDNRGASLVQALRDVLTN